MCTRTKILFLSFFSLIWSQDCCDALDIANDDCGGIGCYIPQCTDTCEWEPMQCWGSTGYCWCVDEDGVEIEGTSMPSWQGYPECEEFNSVIMGDINGDGIVNVIDIVSLVGFILQTDIPSDSEFSAGDFNLDNQLDVVDIVAIMSLILDMGDTDTTIPEECFLDPDPGPCFGYMQMYFFNQDTQLCEMFIYGGCAGVVPFQSLLECQNTCE